MDREIFNRSHNKKRRKDLRSEMPKAEKMLWQYLRGRKVLNKKCRRQHGIGSFIADFYCPEILLVIEVDGDSHFEEIAIIRDQKRDDYIKKLGITILRFTNNDIYHALESVLEKIEITIKGLER